MSDVEFGIEDLHEYQKIGFEFLLNNPFSALFIDMGLGKTVTVLTLIAHLLDGFEFNRALIIAPLKVANNTWPNEIRKWEHTALIDHVVVTGSEQECRDAVRVPATIHITNRERIEWLVEYWGKDWPYDVVIVDESSSLKDHKTKRFKALKKVRLSVRRKKIDGLNVVMPFIKRMHQLTATPAAETYEHLFAQIFLLDLGERLGRNVTAFRTSYFVKNDYTYKYTIRSEKDKEEIAEKISDITLTMKREDYFELQEPISTIRHVELSSEEMKIYKKMKRDLLVTIGDTEIEAETAAALSSKLLQISSGGLYDENKEFHPIHNRKTEELKSIVEESVGQPLLVAYHFKSTLERLQKAFPQAVVMDREGKCVKKWNDRKIPMLLVHPQSAGHGLNLQKGGHHLVLYDLPWSLELYLQLIGRLDRQGQTETVVLHHIVAKGTLDELVVRCLKEKRDAQDHLFRMLRRIARRRAQVFDL